MSSCGSCHQGVRWVRMQRTGRANPVDPQPSIRGNIRLHGPGANVGEVLGKDEAAAAREAGEQLYLSHFASCPNAKRHRKGSGGGRAG